MSSEQIVRRLLGESDMTFTTRLKQRTEVDVYHSSEWVDGNAEVLIEWSLQLDVRSFGIKSFDVTVNKVTAYMWLIDELDREHQEVITVPSVAPEAPAEGDIRGELLHYGRPDDYKIVTKFNTREAGSNDYMLGVMPLHAEIDMRKRRIEISF